VCCSDRLNPPPEAEWQPSVLQYGWATKPTFATTISPICFAPVADLRDRYLDRRVSTPLRSFSCERRMTRPDPERLFARRRLNDARDPQADPLAMTLSSPAAPLGTSMCRPEPPRVADRAEPCSSSRPPSAGNWQPCHRILLLTTQDRYTPLQSGTAHLVRSSHRRRAAPLERGLADDFCDLRAAAAQHLEIRRVQRQE
jgi:hypothetical protein